MSGEKRGLGLSLLKNLGLKEEQIVEETFELKVRPKGAGFSREIDFVPETAPILRAVGAWRVGGPEIRGMGTCPAPGKHDVFCQGRMFPKLQASLCRFHERFEKVPESQVESLSMKLDNLKMSMGVLEERKGGIEGLCDAHESMRSLAEAVLRDPQNYDVMFKCVLELARNPGLLMSREPAEKKYQKHDTDSFSVPHIAMVVAAAYSERLLEASIFRLEHLKEWLTLRQWLLNVHEVLVGLNNSPDKLWVKFMKRVIFPEVQELLNIESAGACVSWVDAWAKSGLLSHSDLKVFFLQVAKPFLVGNLQELCRSFEVSQWIDLANECDLSSQFAIIVRLHAEKILKNWCPPSPVALQLISQWPHTLGTSGDFLYKVIAPKLSVRLSCGDIQSFLPFVAILPDSLAASLIADSYITYIISEIDRVMKLDARKAATIYADARNAIPARLIHTQKVKARLIDALNKLKERNPMLRGLKVEKEPTQASIADLLESISRETNTVFMPQGTVDGRTSYLLGTHLCSVVDGVLYHQTKAGWIPILVRDLRSLCL